MNHEDKQIRDDDLFLLRNRQKRLQTFLILSAVPLAFGVFLLALLDAFFPEVGIMRGFADIISDKYVLSAFCILYAVMIGVSIYSNKIGNRLQDIQLGIERVRSNLPDDFEGKVLDLNLRYLDQYYLETKNQSNKSFASALVIGFASFVLIGVAITFFTKGSVNVGYVTLVSGTITQFISSVFFYLFNKTVLSMASYHQRLVFTQNIAFSLRIVQGLEGEAKIKMSEMIISHLLQDLNSHLAGK